MRKIKFRIWDKEANDWMFGYNYPNLGGFSLIGEVTLMGELSRISLDKLSKDNYAIMQYTGLKDKNGVEIYEGDIIYEITTYPGGGGLTLKFQIGFELGAFHLCTRGENGKLYADYLLGERDNLYVKGNIYENPELLDTNQIMN